MTKIAEVNGISIHAPAKGATSGRNRRRHRGPKFQSTLPRRERRRASCPSPRRSRYFNPRSREGSDAAGLHTAAPVRHFNPRSREGSDVPQDLHLLSALCISIHAPAKGATWQAVRSRRVSHFNPRSREGSDATFPRPRLRRDTRFQSTLPRRERPRWQARSSSSFPFQSTLPRRERPIITGLVTLVVLFQSTLPRRERRLSGRHPPGHRGISIHAPAKGATYSRSFGRPPDNISIHAPAKGATRQIPGQIVQHSISIHAPAKGATFAKLI